MLLFDSYTGSHGCVLLTSNVPWFFLPKIETQKTLAPQIREDSETIYAGVLYM